MDNINWAELIVFFLSNAVLLVTGYVNMQIKISNLDIKLLNFDKSMEKLVNKVDTLDKHQLDLHTKLTRLETRFEMIERER